MYVQNTIDPQNIREESTGDFNNILALEHMGNDLYFTTTDFGVEGTLSWISSFNGIAYQTQELHSTSTDGTLIRNPVELQSNKDHSDTFPQDLWMLDYEAQLCFPIPTIKSRYILRDKNIPKALLLERFLITMYYLSVEKRIFGTKRY